MPREFYLRCETCGVGRAIIAYAYDAEHINYAWGGHLFCAACLCDYYRRWIDQVREELSA